MRSYFNAFHFPFKVENYYSARNKDVLLDIKNARYFSPRKLNFKLVGAPLRMVMTTVEKGLPMQQTVGELSKAIIDLSSYLSVRFTFACGWKKFSADKFSSC